MNAQEIKAQLEKEYKYRLELHAHSKPASGCSEVPVPDLVALYAELGYQGVVLTNHFIYDYSTCMRGRSVEEGIEVWLNDYRAAVEEGKKYGLAVFLGAEIRFTENNNDYLIYGLTEKMLPEIYRLLPEGIEHFRRNYAMPDSVFAEILSGCSVRRDGVKKLLLSGLKTGDRVAEYCSYLVRYGDESVVKELEAFRDCVDDYVSFKELDLAIEALGGVSDRSRDFEEDLDYIKIKEAEKTVNDVGEDKD